MNVVNTIAVRALVLVQLSVMAASGAAFAGGCRDANAKCWTPSAEGAEAFESLAKCISVSEEKDPTAGLDYHFNGYVVGRNENGEPGVFIAPRGTFISTKDMAPGEHVVKVNEFGRPSRYVVIKVPMLGKVKVTILERAKRPSIVHRTIESKIQRFTKGQELLFEKRIQGNFEELLKKMGTKDKLSASVKQSLELVAPEQLELGDSQVIRSKAHKCREIARNSRNRKLEDILNRTIKKIDSAAPAALASESDRDLKEIVLAGETPSTMPQGALGSGSAE